MHLLDFMMYMLQFVRERGAELVSTLGENSEFVELNINNAKMMEAALEGAAFILSVLTFYRKLPLTALCLHVSEDFFVSSYVISCLHTLKFLYQLHL